MSAETERSQPKLWPTRERITTPDGPVVVDGFRILDCCWLALVPSSAHMVRSGWAVHHAPSGCALEHFHSKDTAVSLLQRLSEEEWLRSAAVPLAGEDKDRFDAITNEWRAA